MLTVETGSGVPNANTYASLDTVTAYHLAHGNSSWLPSSEDAEPAIHRAMSWLESRSWVGNPVNVVGSSSGQSLQWPRVNVMLDGYAWPSDEIPPGVVNALCEAALIELVTPGALSPSLKRGGMVKSKKIDIITTTYFSGAPSGTTYRALQMALRGLVLAGNVVRIER